MNDENESIKHHSIVFRETGDLVEINALGKIYYKGRCGSVVKRFGNRLNLTELETCVAQLSCIASCVAIWDDTSRKLHLCVSPDENEEKNELIESVKLQFGKLPSFYHPDRIHVIDQLKLTDHGKLDKKFLETLCFDEAESDKILEIPVDAKFECIWKNFLKICDGGFVTSGGTSISALQISTELSECTDGTDFPELIGMLLKDFTYHQCLEYVKREFNQRHSKQQSTSRVQIHMNYSKLENTNESGEKINDTFDNHKSSLSHKKRRKIYAWQKCRGRSNKFFENILNNSVNANLKLEIYKSYNLKKCIDASPTLFQYSE